MEFSEFIKRTRKIREVYNEVNKNKGEKLWGFAEHAEGLVGDIGELMKLVMAKKGLRTISDLDEKLAHELVDCLWSILIIADELNIDLEKEFFEQKFDQINE